MDLVVRELRRRDIPQVVELFQLAFPRELAISGFDPTTVARQLRLYGLIRPLQRLRPFFLFRVGELAGKVVAAVTLNRERRGWYIGTVMVHPDYRRRGYGRSVLLHALEATRSLGGNRAILHVLADNTPARRLYESAGFREFERISELVREPPEGEERPLPGGYRLRRIPRFDRRAARIGYAAMNPTAREVYGEPELPPWYLRLFSLLLPGVYERYAVVQGGEWVGVYRFSAPFRDRGAASIGISLLPEQRGRGLEEALLSRSLRRAREVGCPRLTIAVDQENAPLLYACRKLGFQELHTTLGMYRDL